MFLPLLVCQIPVHHLRDWTAKIPPLFSCSPSLISAAYGCSTEHAEARGPLGAWARRAGFSAEQQASAGPSCGRWQLIVRRRVSPEQPLQWGLSAGSLTGVSGAGKGCSVSVLSNH